MASFVRAAHAVLITPPSFQSLAAPIAHDAPRTFAFRGYDLLVREEDGALPDPATVKSMGIVAAQVFPVGLFRAEYCCTAWVEKATAAPAGFTFRK